MSKYLIINLLIIDEEEKKLKFWLLFSDLCLSWGWAGLG